VQWLSVIFQNSFSFAFLKSNLTSSMKKLLLMIVAFSGITVLFAQRNNVESAAIYLRNLEMEDAKKAIDAAAEHDETKNDPKMWYYRAAIYDTIYRNPEFSKLDNNTVEKFVVSCKKCIETDTKKRYSDYCDIAVVNAGIAAYIKAYDAVNAQNSTEAYKYFQYVLEVLPYDKNSFLKKENINEKTIILNLIKLAIDTKNTDAAKANLQKLMDMNYEDPNVYLTMSNIYFEEKNDVKGLEYLEKGRKLFPSNTSLITMELNYYIKKGQQDALMKKLDDAIAIDNESPMLYFVRGNVFDNYASNAMKRSTYLKDTAETVSKKAKAATPANKPKLDAAVKSFRKEADSLTAASKVYMNNAEADYKKVIELKDDYIDAYYNLGALTNNRTTEIVDKMNNVPTASQAEYDKKWGALKKERDALLVKALEYFSKALELGETLPETDQAQKDNKRQTMYSILLNMQQLYAQLGDEKKSNEARQRKLEYQ
jgi:hypothetical protein